MGGIDALDSNYDARKFMLRFALRATYTRGKTQGQNLHWYRLLRGYRRNPMLTSTHVPDSGY